MTNTNNSPAPERIDQATLLQEQTDPLTHTPVHLLELKDVGKHYGNIIALTGVTMADVNGDGHVDIYVSGIEYLTMHGRNVLYINNGNATVLRQR